MKVNDEIFEELVKIYYEDIEDNDASYVPFGYAFQADAGLILFMKHFSEIVNISIESKLQDIQMTKDNGDLILAQAKSSQKPLKTTSEKAKLHDALFSLIKTNNKNSDVLIYVSNLRDPLKSNEKNIFDLKELNYGDLSPEAEANVKEQISKIKSKLMSVINDTTNSKKIIDKSTIILKHLENFNYENLFFMSIPNYYGNDNREKVIVDEIAKFLSNTMDYSLDISIIMAQKVYKIWHEKVMFDSTISSNSKNKNIDKDDLLWPLVVLFERDIQPSVLQDIVDFEITVSLENKIRLIANEEFLKLNNFRIVHKILNDYNEYKKNKNPKGVLLKYIQSNWEGYQELFDYLQHDDEIKKCVTMLFIYKIVENHNNVQKVLKGGNINGN